MKRPRSEPGAADRAAGFLKRSDQLRRAALVAFLFFLLKGVAWLALGALAYFGFRG